MGFPRTQAPDQRAKFGILAIEVFNEPRPTRGHLKQPVQPRPSDFSESLTDLCTFAREKPVHSWSGDRSYFSVYLLTRS